MKKRIVEIAVKVIVAALTAFLTAITTTSCLFDGDYDDFVPGARADYTLNKWGSQYQAAGLFFRGIIGC